MKDNIANVCLSFRVGVLNCVVGSFIIELMLIVIGIVAIVALVLHRFVLIWLIALLVAIQYALLILVILASLICIVLRLYFTHSSLYV